MHFLFIPQLINFLYSVPQLFGFYHCPRHRLTVYSPKDDTLTGVKTNMNLLNLSLRIIGPTNEGVLCFKLLLFQIVLSAVGIVIGVCFGWATEIEEYHRFVLYIILYLFYLYIHLSVSFLLFLLVLALLLLLNPLFVEGIVNVSSGPKMGPIKSSEVPLLIEF